METLTAKVRKLGYELACREIYGENTPDYHKLRRLHERLLNKLDALQKKS